MIGLLLNLIIILLLGWLGITAIDVIPMDGALKRVGRVAVIVIVVVLVLKLLLPFLAI